MAMARVLQKSKIPMISPSSTNPGVTRVGDYIFRVCFDDKFQGRVMADFAADYLDAATAVVMTNINSKYSTGLADCVISRFREKGKILWEADYPQNTIDFTLYLEKIKLLNPDVAFVPDHYRESAYIIKQAGKMGLKLSFIGGDGWLTQMYRYGGDYIDGNFYVAQWHDESPDEVSRAFVKRYGKKYGRANEPAIALTYDAVTLLVWAVERAASLDPEKIRNALAATKKFRGVTGYITFDENGDPIDKPAVILRFENNDSVYFKTVGP
ncbi:MAG: hypothetical protein B6230_03140 [Desulfobacteraceae bacterium 4572_89]|nr:MAG: hypothetical protein B6230_03140 [Desulfobacteraceae bacterium 4572_89]